MHSIYKLRYVVSSLIALSSAKDSPASSFPPPGPSEISRRILIILFYAIASVPLEVDEIMQISLSGVSENFWYLALELNKGCDPGLPRVSGHG